MFVVFAIISLCIFIRTISYGIFEIKTNNNTFAGIVTFIIAIIGLVFPNIVIWVNGLY